MQNQTLEDCTRLRSLYEERLKPGPYPTSEVTLRRFPEPAPGILSTYLADIAGIASHGAKLIELEMLRRNQFRKVVAESFAEKWPRISLQITLNETPRLHRLMDDTEEARVLIKKVLGA
jgi:hypothetical protein